MNFPKRIEEQTEKLKQEMFGDISRQNLYSHLSSKHPGLLSSFKAACIRGEQTPSKRNREEDSDTADLQGKNQIALKDCTKALELNPTYFKALMRRAKLYEELDQLDKALADYKELHELQPTNGELIVP
ncbi:tetratricopeptide repeat protein 1-like [Daphnia pulicaria]|uniref:tetratricopeptide repeat protein 1-like n=1 Tax=Daphnia pulicaria TaxID=35523 RepID=UPI001EEC0999|nr:tetratricopeptide repeat protein 1-like [Daphnia pulicaria]